MHLNTPDCVIGSEDYFSFIFILFYVHGRQFLNFFIFSMRFSAHMHQEQFQRIPTRFIDKLIDIICLHV